MNDYYKILPIDSNFDSLTKKDKKKNYEIGDKQPKINFKSELEKALKRINFDESKFTERFNYYRNMYKNQFNFNDYDFTYKQQPIKKYEQPITYQKAISKYKNNS